MSKTNKSNCSSIRRFFADEASRHSLTVDSVIPETASKAAVTLWSFVLSSSTISICRAIFSVTRKSLREHEGQLFLPAVTRRIVKHQTCINVAVVSAEFSIQLLTSQGILTLPKLVKLGNYYYWRCDSPPFHLP